MKLSKRRLHVDSGAVPMTERIVLGCLNKSKQINVVLQYRYTDNHPVLTVGSQTNDGFTEKELKAIIDYFQTFINRSTPTNRKEASQ